MRSYRGYCFICGNCKKKQTKTRKISKENGDGRVEVIKNILIVGMVYVQVIAGSGGRGGVDSSVEYSCDYVEG